MHSLDQSRLIPPLFIGGVALGMILARDMIGAIIARTFVLNAIGYTAAVVLLLFSLLGLVLIVRTKQRDSSFRGVFSDGLGCSPSRKSCSSPRCGC